MNTDCKKEKKTPFATSGKPKKQRKWKIGNCPLFPSGKCRLLSGEALGKDNKREKDCEQIVFER